MMEKIELKPSPAVSPRRIMCLTIVALYGPYTLLFFEAEPSWALVWIWPIFPGLGLSLLTKPYPASWD